MAGPVPQREDIDIVGLALKDRYRNVHEYLESFNEYELDNEDDNPNPPVEVELPNTVFGITIEFAMATCRVNPDKDPHPGETRWLPSYLTQCKLDSRATRYLNPTDEAVWTLWVRDHILTTFKQRLMHTTTFTDPSLFPSHDVESEKEYYDKEWMGIIEGREQKSFTKTFLDPSNDFYVEYVEDTPEHTLVVEAANEFLHKVTGYLRQNYLHMNWTLDSTWHELFSAIGTSTYLEGEWPWDLVDWLIEELYARSLLFSVEIHQLFENWESNFAQTDYFIMRRMRKENAFFTVGGTDEMLVEFLNDRDYGLPSNDAMPPGKDAAAVTRQYKWFKGKLRTPILQHDWDKGWRLVRKMCRYMRKTYRIHKPMSTLGGTVCIHLGSDMEWSLLELKRLATLWIILEERITKFFRSERCSQYTNRPVVSYSRIGRYNLEHKTREIVPDYDFDFEAVAELEWFRYRGFADWRRQELHAHVPSHVFPERSHIPALLDDIWQYPSINMLREGLSDIDQPNNLTVHFNVSGYKRTGDESYLRTDQTRDSSVDFRLMQANMDVSYIRDWTLFLSALGESVRLWSAEKFRNTLIELWESSSGEHVYTRIGKAFDVQYEVERLAFLNHPDDDDEYLRYPDGDEVDWTQPFMTPATNSMYREDPGVNPDPFESPPPFQPESEEDSDLSSE